jgi:magnesium chelatase family protein
MFKTDLDSIRNAGTPDELDFEDMKGQEHAKRGLEVAAAGSGKTMPAQRLSTILI